MKLETIKLNESPIAIRASYCSGSSGNDTNTTAIATNRLQCQESSLNGVDFVVPNHRVACNGTLIGYNTLESFQTVDKNALLKDHLLSNLFGKNDNKSVQALSSFLLLTFADLKQHQVLYWFGFPVLLTKKSVTAEVVQDAQDMPWQALAQGLQTYRNVHDKLPPFFVLSDESFIPLSATCLQDLGGVDDNDMSALVFGFVDPASTLSSPSDGVPLMGWPMRNLAAYLVLRMGFGGKTVKIVSVRSGSGLLKCKIPVCGSSDDGDTPHSVEILPADVELLSRSSIVMQVTLPITEDYDYSTTDDDTDDKPVYKVVGWELNARQKPGPRFVNLRPLLDQNHLAIQAADLNLKLMKWRMIPSLNVDMLQSTKVLLLGAGTLGCSVARTLLGWGIRNFKFVDYGTVSYSNPVRQNLFTLEDCHFNHGQGRPKAQAAADALKTIAADVTAEGIYLSIPMPGHAAETTSTKSDSSGGKTALEDTVERLDQLVQEADIVFLLTDTRESRWLPTIMAAVHDKPIINAALGLDSWLVMRHGGGNGGESEDSTPNSTQRLGCYFCNDVVAPENSTKNRTLDQQCTVTRPGLAPIASSMAVELLVSMMHHSKRHHAPAPTSQASTYAPGGSGKDSKDSSSALGVIPHQIRGSLVSYTMMTPTVPAFKCCTGCAVPVMESYKEDKYGLVSSVCASMDGSYLEDLSGLTAFRAEAADMMAGMEDDWDVDEA